MGLRDRKAGSQKKLIDMSLEDPIPKLTRDWLAAVTWIYLAIPYCIFFWSWLWFPYAGIVLALLVLAVGFAVSAELTLSRRIALYASATNHSDFRNELGVYPAQTLRVSTWGIGAFVLSVVAVGMLWGTGGYGPQDVDHPKHNALLKTLINEPWPAWVESDRGNFPLVYYTAFYLPAAAVGKALGWSAANHALQLWALIGLVLSLTWFCRLSGGFLARNVLLFLVFSGLDIISTLIFRWNELLGTSFQQLSSGNWGAVDWRTFRFWNWQLDAGDIWLGRTYPSHCELGFFAPQHGIVGWVAAGLLLREGTLSVSLRPAKIALLWALTTLWSPFISIGLIPVIVASLLASNVPSRRRTLTETLTDWLAAFAIGGMVALYYFSRWCEMPFSAAPESGFGLGSIFMTPWTFTWRLILFVLLEVGVLIGLVWAAGVISPNLKKTLTISAIFLVVLPIFRYGGLNDLVMRASIPALFVVAAATGQTLVRWSKIGVYRWLIVAVLLIAASNPFSHAYRHIREVIRRGYWIEIPKVQHVASLWQINEEWKRQARNPNNPWMRNFTEDTFFVQYIGSPQSFFFRYLTPSRSLDI